MSTWVCQIEIIEISGTIDLAKGNVFVEKGKNYRWIHSEVSLYSMSNINSDVVMVTYGGDIITAVDEGITNISYLYQQDGILANSYCTFNVYETVDVSSYQTNSTDNFYIVLNGGVKFTITYEEEGTEKYPAGYAANYSKYYDQEFHIIPAEDGYYYIYSPYHEAYLVVEDSVPSIDSNLIFTSSLSLDETMVTKWKFLTRETMESFFMVPQGGENEQVLMCLPNNSIGAIWGLGAYSSSTSRNFQFYNSNIYINNYYDYSLANNVGPDAIILGLIDEAHAFANNVLQALFRFHADFNEFNSYIHTGFTGRSVPCGH